MTPAQENTGVTVTHEGSGHRGLILFWFFSPVFPRATLLRSAVGMYLGPDRPPGDNRPLNVFLAE